MHPLAQIFTDQVLNHPTGYSFNTVSCLDYPWVHDCNLFFPVKNGYNWDEYGRKIPHPDDNKTFFFWRTYSQPQSYEESRDDPEYIHSHWELFVLDGTSKYNYEQEVPIEVLRPDDETPTDRQRRYLQYRKNECIWGLLDCHCSTTGPPCLKIENERYQCSCEEGKIYSLSTDLDNTLEARMMRSGWEGDTIQLE